MSFFFFQIPSQMETISREDLMIITYGYVMSCDEIFHIYVVDFFKKLLNEFSDIYTLCLISMCLVLRLLNGFSDIYTPYSI